MDKGPKVMLSAWAKAHGTKENFAKRMMGGAIAVLLVALLAACAPVHKQPVTKPSPKPTTPATPVPATPPPAKPSEPCPDTPDATTGKMDVRWNSARTVAWIDFTPKHNDREDDTTFCLDHFGADGPWPDGRMLVVCPLRPEGHPERKTCERLKGLPVWFVNDAETPSDEGEPFMIHVGALDRVKVCFAKHPERCLPEMTVTP